jgi:hypothetical protein
LKGYAINSPYFDDHPLGGTMKRILLLAAVLVIPASMVLVNVARSSDCSNAMVEAMLEEGITREQINRICLKAAMKEEGLTDEQIGRIISKTEAMPPMTNQPGTTSAVPAPAAMPVITPSAPAPVPKVLSPDFPPSKIDADIIGKCVGGILGWCFEKGEYRQIEIEETDIDHKRAKVIFYLETIKNHTGKLIAYYQQIDGQWKLDKLDSLTFK